MVCFSYSIIVKHTGTQLPKQEIRMTELKLPSLNSAFYSEDDAAAAAASYPVSGTAYKSTLPENWKANLSIGDFDLSSLNTYKSNKLNVDGSSNSTDTPWYQDKDAMSGYAGLASTLMQAVALPDQLKYMKNQNKALEQNIAQAKADSAINATARANLNKPMTSVGGV